MFTEKKRLKLMSLIITGSLFGGMYTSNNSVPVLAATGETSSVEVVNSTFDDNTDNWWGSGDAHIARVTTSAGAYLAVTGRTANYNGPQTDLSGKIQGGKTYETSVWVKFDGVDGETKTFKVTLDSMIDGTQGYNQMLSQAVPANTWTQITGTFDCPAGVVTKARPYVECSDPSADFYIDDFKITTQAGEDAPQATAYTQTFEEGLDGWSARGSAAVSQDSSQKQEGNSSLTISGRTKTWEGPIKDLTSALTKGETYHFSAYVMYDDESGLDSQEFDLQTEIKTGDSADYKTIGKGTAKKGEWTKIEGDYTVPSGSTGFSIYIEFPYKDDKTTTIPASDKINFYLDNVVVTKTVVAKKEYQKDIPQLKNIFNEYFPFGTSVSPSELDGDNVHSDFIKYQYGAIVPDNCMKPEAIQPTEGTFTWDNADKTVDFANANGMVLRGHTLVWHSQVPDWFFQDPEDLSKPASRELLLERMKTHIQTVMTRYKGRVDYWDVVNEVISDKSGLRGEEEGSKWRSIIGDVDGDGYDDDYIRLAFEYAKEADPDAVLMINDYGTEGSARKRDDLYNIVERLLKKGTPIEGIGLQSHISMYSPSAEQIKETIEKFASLKKYNPNFTVQVTELDMSIYSGNSEGTKTPTEDVLAQQAAQYKKIFDVYKEESEKGNLSLVMVWGNSDDNSWLDNFPVKNRPDAGLLFDRNLQAKPAYWAIVNPTQAGVFKQEVNVANGTPVIGSSVDKKWMTVKPFDVNSFVKGVGGATAKVKTMWDANNLYVFAEVNDETVGDKDGVEIFADNGLGEYVKYSINRSTDADTIKVTSTSTGYEIQAKLPLGNIPAELGTKIAFDMKVNDNASNGDITSSVVWNDYASESTEETLKPENGGTLVFSQESKLVETKKGTPNIDGNIDGIWNTANAISTDVSVQGTNAAKAKVRILWDEDYIYALYEVTDSNLDKSSKNSYEQDSVETFIDENNARTSAYDNDDAQYRVNYDNEQSGGGNRITDKFKSTTTKIDNGYIVEMAIPLNKEAVANQIIGFDAQVNDAAEGVRNGVNIWCDATGQTWSTTSNVGNIMLVDSASEGNSGGSGSNSGGSSSNGSSSNSSGSSNGSNGSVNNAVTSGNPQAAKNGWVLNANNKWTFVENGNNVVGWKFVNNKWYFMDNNGQMKTGWAQDSTGKWYFLKNTGEMQTGWLKDTDGKWYFLKNTGEMAAGWVKDTDGKWYFLKNSGEMVTGWTKDTDGKWYFLNSSGEMLYNTTINGYKLGSDGAWIK